MKYVSVDFATRHSAPWVAETVLHMVRVLPRQRQHVAVDVKYWDHLNVGDMPALPHWHLDCDQFDTSGTESEDLLLYSFGAGCRTQFLSEDVEVGGPWPATWTPPVPVFQAPEGRVVQYTRRHIHAASPATRAGPRLLIRVAAGELIRPRDGFYTPYRRRAP